MNYNLTTSEEVIARVLRDFKVNNINWKASAYDWIADGMGAINAWFAFETKEKDINICEHKGHYPCDLIELIGVKYNGRKLPLGKNIAKIPNTGLLTCRDVQSDLGNYEKVRDLNAKLQLLEDTQSIYDATQRPEDLERIVTLTKQIAQFSVPYNTSLHNNYGLHYYNLKPGAIETTFDTGVITLIYTGSVSDDRGFPLIPDVFEFKEALAWFIINRLLLGGYDHPVLNWETSEKKWDILKKQARNKIKYPTLDRMQALANMWTSPVFDRTLPDDFFARAQNINGIDYEA